MTNMSAQTGSEKRLVRGIQRAVGAREDGILGPASAVDLAAMVGAEVWPVTVQLFGAPVIVCEDVIACDPNAGCRSFTNSISGSFSYAGKPCSILVSEGKVVCGTACHGWLDKPETVVYRRRNGEVGIQRVKTVAELPEDLRWAIGGVGLGEMYDPKAEGFCRFTAGGRTYDYSDVLRRTNHTMMGVKHGLVYLVYCPGMTGQGVDQLRAKLGLEMAIMLDGGHVAAINGAESFARKNVGQIQHYLIQGV